MEVELHIETLDPERRWNRLVQFNGAPPERGVILGRFLSMRDDDTFVWLHGFRDRDERLASQCAPAHTLVPAAGSTVTELDEFARLAELPVLEIRQYRIVPGKRARFAAFLRDCVIEEHVRRGMPILGQFDALDDDNVFVFFRAFTDLVERDRLKAEYYQSRRWLETLQDEAFSMIEDYRNVLLVTPVRP